jgi:hypothetical protein
MCCFISVLLLFGPRLAIIVGYLLDPRRFDAAMGSFLLSCLGFIFLPWTLLAYVLVWQPIGGVQGFGWVIVALAFFVDLGAYGGGYRNRRSVAL